MRPFACKDSVRDTASTHESAFILKSVPLLLEPDPHSDGQRGVPRPEREGLIHDAVVAMGRNLLPKGSQPGTLLIIGELVLGHGRPDVTVAAIDSRAWRARMRAEIEPITAPLPLTVACALEELSGRGTLAELRQALPRHSAAAVNKGARELANRGWLASNKGGLLVLERRTKPGLGAVAAVEAKVDNWRRAARQAIAWINHVDAAWLAFPKSYLRNVPRRDPYIARLGLIAVNGDASKGQSVRRPRSAKARGVQRRITEEQIYARWLAAHS